ncbi:MAG TPA: alpha/beta hydrolase [Dehalococcoidia bacterium]|jgi:valacyclovir hydrolase
MSWFEYKKARIYYEEAGSGEPLLLVPGWGGSIEEFGDLRQALASKYRVIAADAPGSGRSGPQPREYTSSYYRQDVEAFAALLEDLGALPAHLLGFSDGGEYALLLAAVHPEMARSIVSWGAAGALPESASALTDAFGDLVDAPIPPLADFSAYMRGAYGVENARIMSQSAARALRDIIAAGGDISRSRAGNITCPALLITGEEDFLATPAIVAEMAAAIGHGEFVEVKGAEHPVHATHGEWLTQKITSWLAELPRGEFANR